MQNKNYILQLFSCMFLMLLLVGFFQSWNLALSIFNLCIISAIMSLGINIQWGNAGIVNFGVMGFAALGGLANVIISMPPTLQRMGRRWYFNSVWYCNIHYINILFYLFMEEIKY